MNLSQLQSEFSASLKGEGFDLERFAINGPFPAEQLLQLYRNNFRISLSEYLQACFPVCIQLVGEEFFNYLSRDYIDQTPLQQAELESYGEGFPGFIEQHDAIQTVPYLADIAKLEWLLDKASNLARIEPFPYPRFQQLSSEQQGQARLVLSKQARDLNSPYPIASIWQGVASGDLENIDMATAESVLVYPLNPGKSGLAVLSADEQALFQAISEATPLANLHGLAEPCLQHSLNQWIGHNIINDFYLAEGDVL